MYADRSNGVGNRKRSIRDRLGGLNEPAFAGPQSTAKRLRDVEGQWKHDMYFDDRDDGPRERGQDLRSKLQRSGSRTVNQPRAGNVVDLRDKLSGLADQSQQTSRAHEAPKLQRRVASVVYNSSTVTQGVASVTAPAPVSARPAASVKRPSDIPMAAEQTVRTLLHSLGLEKYLITFQTEEIDMAALRFMSDNDLKELGIPMGPRKKIMLAIRGKE